MERRRSTRRRQKLPFAQRAKEHCRQFTAFMFSNLGIIILVVAYMTGGRFLSGSLAECRKKLPNIKMHAGIFFLHYFGSPFFSAFCFGILSRHFFNALTNSYHIYIDFINNNYLNCTTTNVPFLLPTTIPLSLVFGSLRIIIDTLQKITEGDNHLTVIS